MYFILLGDVLRYHINMTCSYHSTMWHKMTCFSSIWTQLESWYFIVEMYFLVVIHNWSRASGDNGPLQDGFFLAWVAVVLHCVCKICNRDAITILENIFLLFFLDGGGKRWAFLWGHFVCNLVIMKQQKMWADYKTIRANLLWFVVKGLSNINTCNFLWLFL